MDGTWLIDAISEDFTETHDGVAVEGAFWATYCWGDWGTYHYDYIKGQSRTVVTVPP